MSGQQIGYIRVSSVGQNTERQLYEVQLDKVFKEEISAKDTNRPQLAACLDYIREGDTLHVHSMDRLARNLRDLESIVEAVRAKGASVKFHKEGMVFNGQDDSMAKLMLQMMGAFAEFERNLINERRVEGQARARAQGKHMGRSKQLNDSQIADLKQRAENGEPKAQLAKDFGISRPTLYTYLKGQHV